MSVDATYLARMLRRRSRSSALAFAAIAGIGLLAGCVALPPEVPPVAPPIQSPAAPPVEPPAGLGAEPPAGSAAEPTHPPSSEALDDEAWAVLEPRAFGAYDIYLELVAGLTGDAAIDRALLEQAATPEQVTWELDQRQQIAETGGRVEGRPRVESFAMLRDLDAMVAHVCQDVSDLRLVLAETGEVVADGAHMRELLVSFAMAEDGRMLVSEVRQVLEHERNCA